MKCTHKGGEQLDSPCSHCIKIKADAYDKLKEMILALNNKVSDLNIYKHATDCESIGCRCGSCPCTCYLWDIWSMEFLIDDVEMES